MAILKYFLVISRGFPLLTDDLIIIFSQVKCNDICIHQIKNNNKNSYKIV